MFNNNPYKIISYCIASVWLINGLFCKVLNFVPRHEQIVARILSHNYSRRLTIMIGLSEVLMCIWVLSNIKSRINAITQIVIILTMNTLEFILVPDILLWGKLNSFFALLFVTLIYYNEFYLKQKK